MIKPFEILYQVNFFNFDTLTNTADKGVYYAMNESIHYALGLVIFQWGRFHGPYVFEDLSSVLAQEQPSHNIVVCEPASTKTKLYFHHSISRLIFCILGLYVTIICSRSVFNEGAQYFDTQYSIIAD